ncbi:hypothetical protein [Pseudobutyrivibrio xylanivorans]|uniref:Uncharacterized protein n=1 Tax=Pseudobutyrivibrio xylanivorans TaxID=185007 RepID=A0A5P6VW69_PSEXY|nr:hypothetical protein [Pseudobutyrivibrio xylanivorans]QFJ56414.1 hypothetical protein FXF36_16005 [Pseudobutyrivibrio xylanivorans]
MFLSIIEGIVLCFALLMVCVINIQNGPVGGVHYYEKPVQERVTEMGLITEKQIKRNLLWSAIVLMAALVIVAPLMMIYINHTNAFADGFIQLLIMYMVCGIFDRCFIDWYWVGHTKAWLIPGTEDLMPYIHKETWIKKIVLTVILYPALAALLSWLLFG